MASKSKVYIFDDEEDPVVSSGGADSLWDTIETVLVKEYDSKDVAILRLFFDKELIEIGQVGVLTLEPPQGPGLKLLIKCKESRKERIDPLIKDLDSKLGMIEGREVTVQNDAFAKLAEHMRSEEKRLIDAQQKERVLYRPDIVKKLVNVYFWPGNEKAVMKLRRELGVTQTGGTRNRSAPSDQAEGENPSGAASRLYPDLKIKAPNDKDPARSFGRSVSLDQARSTGDDNAYEEMVWETSPKTTAKPRSDIFVKHFSGEKLTLLVYKGSILRLPVDAIVNAANDNMDHGEGVAKLISEAAGWDLDKESKDKLHNGLLPVSRNIVTTAGKLRHYRGVIHAVGPQWYDSKYRDDKIFCLDDLYDTIKNVLETCDRKGYQTVAMPAISAGIYGVPKELCADMYVKAAAHYSQIPGSRLPKELHIVDIDQEILDLVEKSVEKYDKNPKSLEQRETVRAYLDSHPQTSRRDRGRGQQGGQGWNRDHGNNQSYGSSQSQVHGSSLTSESKLPFKDLAITCEVNKLKEEKFRWGGIAQMYILNKDLTVKIYKGDITRSSHFDALVCGIDPNLQFSGFFAEALIRAGGDAFEDHMNKIFKKANKVKQGDILRCKPGKLKVENIVFVVADKLIDVGNKEQKNYRDWVNNLLKKTHEWNFKRIAIPLFSTGQLQTNENELQKCAIALLQALDNFAENKSGTKLTMMEIHLVNNNDLVTSTLVKVFDVASKTRGHNVGITPSSGSDSNWKAAGKGQVTITHLESSNKNDRHTQQHRTGDAGFSRSYRSNDTPAIKEKYKKDVGSSPPKGNGAARYQTVDAKPREERHYDAIDDATGVAIYGGSRNFSDEDVEQPAYSRPKQSSTLPTDSRHTSEGGSHDLDIKLGTIEGREVTVPIDSFTKLAEHMRSEEKRQTDSHQKDRVLYRPDIRELGIIETGGTRHRSAPTDQAVASMQSTFSVYDSSTFEGSIRRDLPNQAKQDDDYDERMDWKDGVQRCSREQCKQIVLNALGLKTWEDVEDSYDQADNMLQYTGDVSTSEGRIQFLVRALELAKMGKTTWSVNITVKRNGVSVPVDKQLKDKHSSAILKEMKNKSY